MENIPLIFWLVPVASVTALLFALHFYRSMKKADEGTPRMKEIASFIRRGAMAYLRQQYKVVLIAFAVLALFFAVLAFGLNVQNHWVPFAFLTGGLFSGLAGFFGMKAATYASARTANAVSKSLNEGLRIAFRSGAVMGLVVVGLGMLDVSLWYLILNAFIDIDGPQKLIVVTTTMLTFGMGASTQALFARVGGGIYTKAADVGADLVGKVEAGIPEDDPRNPAAIAENMVLEVRRQFRADPGILAGTSHPDYERCVSISTKGAQKEMIFPSSLAIVIPIIVGIIFGVAGVVGLLVGGLSTSIVLAIFMGNAGGAWDNAKKYIEGGNFGGKGSEAHKASIVGDTVGDPFKDTTGPSLDILIKLMSMVSIVVAGLVVSFSIF